MSTDLYMHSVYYSMMLLEGTNYDSYFPCTADCKSLATNKLNSGKPQLCLNREVGLAEAGKIIRFIRGKSIVVFHCSAGFVARLLQSAVPLKGHIIAHLVLL